MFGNIDPSPIPLFVDNLAALSVTNHPNSGAKSRHVALREFRIRDHHEANKIRPYWCPRPLNVANFFSKTLQKNLFNINLKRLGMVGSFRDEVEVPMITAIGSTLHQLRVGAYTMCFMVKLILGVQKPHTIHPKLCDGTTI